MITSKHRTLVIVNAHLDIAAGDDLDFLVLLANTGHGTPDDAWTSDELRDATSAGDWWRSVTGRTDLGTFGSADDIALLREARDAIRTVALRNNGVEVEVVVPTLARLPLQLDLGSGDATLSTAGSTVARDLATRAVVGLVRLPARSDALRFKACPGPGCGWVFRDVTRNGSRRWCDMAACGNRAKAATFRARAQEHRS